MKKIYLQKTIFFLIISLLIAIGFSPMMDGDESLSEHECLPLDTLPINYSFDNNDVFYDDFDDQGFLGITDTGWTPPDPILAAGFHHVVVMTNGAIAFFQKNGTKDFQDEIEDSFGFWGEVGASGMVFDPEVIYDPHSNRFMALACEREFGNSYFLLAISDDANPNGVWHKFRIDVTSIAGDGIDSPNIGVDCQAVYLSADFFTGGQKYLVYIMEKTPLLNGSIGITRDILFTGSQSYGIPVIHGNNPVMYMIEHFEGFTNNLVRLHAITDPLGNPQHETYDITVPTYSPPEDPPQKGTSSTIQTFDSRFWSCVHRDGSLWATHHQGSSVVKARWYEIKTNDWPQSGNPELIQSGDIDPGSDIRTFFTAISVDAYGNAAMCFARSSPDEYISMARCMRNADDPPGEMQEVVIIKESTAPYTMGRWGDYSGISCDPSDNRTFWLHGEYTPGSNSWNTWIAWCKCNLSHISPMITNISNDWNLISLPFNESINKTDIMVNYAGTNYTWVDAVANGYINDFLFGWNRSIQRYRFADSLVPGEGYWLYANIDCELWVENITITIDDFITVIEQDWNMISIPFDEQVSKDDILVDNINWSTAVANGWISDFIFTWNQAGQYYEFTDAFTPGQAYWLYSYQACILKKMI